MFQYVLVIQGNCCISRCSSWALFTHTVSQCQNCRRSYWLWSLYLRFHGGVFSCERIGNASKSTSCLDAQSQVIYCIVGSRGGLVSPLFAISFLFLVQDEPWMFLQWLSLLYLKPELQKLQCHKTQPNDTLKRPFCMQIWPPRRQCA